LRAEESEAQRESLQAQSAKIAAQAEALVRALSTPIITLQPKVLALPLIGEFDRRRAENTTAVLLDRVAAERASHVILDLTGVESVSLETANSLLRMIRTTLLLGVTCIVTGIQPAAAQQFVELESDPGQLHTLARVSDALDFVLRDKGLIR
jgi:rsbT co-antagonist protein RsbR